MDDNGSASEKDKDGIDVLWHLHDIWSLADVGLNDSSKVRMPCNIIAPDLCARLLSTVSKQPLILQVFILVKQKHFMVATFMCWVESSTEYEGSTSLTVNKAQFHLCKHSNYMCKHLDYTGGFSSDFSRHTCINMGAKYYIFLHKAKTNPVDVTLFYQHQRIHSYYNSISTH